jgi:hypothetical protein
MSGLKFLMARTKLQLTVTATLPYKVWSACQARWRLPPKWWLLAVPHSLVLLRDLQPFLYQELNSGSLLIIPAVILKALCPAHTQYFVSLFYQVTCDQPMSATRL